MGYVLASELASLDQIGLKEAITIQLQNNHYPPVPVSMVEPCINAIDACLLEEYDREIELPEGVSWRGNTTAPASAIIDAHHLHAWLDDSDEN
jgi:hypothetical protein